MASPIGKFPELAKAYASSFEQPERQLSMAADEFNTGVTVENAKASASQKLQELRDQVDPSKYQVVRKADGGYDFFDPQGNQIDIATYSERTGARPVDVLKDSENPIDMQYLRDYDLLQDYIQAHFDKDQAKVSEYQKNEPRLKQVKTPEELIELFKRSYRRYYVPRTQDSSAWGQRPGGPLFSNPSASTGGLDLQSLVEQYGG